MLRLSCPRCEQSRYQLHPMGALPGPEILSACLCKHFRNDPAPVTVGRGTGEIYLWARCGYVHATRGVIEIVAGLFPDFASIPILLERLRNKVKDQGAWRLQTTAIAGNEIGQLLEHNGFSAEGHKRRAYRFGATSRDAILWGCLMTDYSSPCVPKTLSHSSDCTSFDPSVDIVPAHPIHAAAYMDFDKTVRLETPNLLRTSSETPASVSEYEEELSALAGQRRNCWLAVTQDGKIIGAITGLSPFGPFAEHDLAIWIAVQQAYWEMGIGRQLLEQMITWARSSGFRRITAELLSTNHRALAFFRRNRFDVEALRRSAALLNDALLDEIVMGRLL